VVAAAARAGVAGIAVTTALDLVATVRRGAGVIAATAA
jgi:hypothetical protein